MNCSNKRRSTCIFREKKKKKRRMRILGACIFSKFFGGKIENFKQTLLAEKFSIK